LASGLPREISVKATQIRAAISRSLRSIVESIKETIEMTPPELVGDILKEGIYLSGGGSLLRGLDQLIEKEISVKASVIEDALTCVARGTGMAAENLKKHYSFFSTAMRPMDIKI
jgi:rod shape-determining protein MreB